MCYLCVWLPACSSSASTMCILPTALALRGLSLHDLVSDRHINGECHVRHFENALYIQISTIASDATRSLQADACLFTPNQHNDEGCHSKLAGRWKSMVQLPTLVCVRNVGHGSDVLSVFAHPEPESCRERGEEEAKAQARQASTPCCTHSVEKYAVLP